MSITLKIQERQPLSLNGTLPRSGVRDISTHLLRCSACGEPLLEVKVIKIPPNAVKLRYQADCPHCGDHSFPTELEGQTAIGSTAKVAWDRTDINGDTVILHTVKIKK